ncbi:KAP family P-loop NTPase fold protein [Verminephrobacter aporrectodeae]|uniref:KAP family P-loop NTPase fold protein n=1 Tax=Verminephrobacter aporrectodeae TaxID=1110389 RepID=UPI00224463DA|nr:P-loop NTPase fold protein [Verminephrobacter aporrectodeae]MCW8176727.1 hypothetical protein [Verminephrobacter aporrectodeae subsp. tuberculatae]MCW8203753.1 hypothetical protein [Verminephrobacter aporrectodeae subsp. tuberculatae]
MTTQPSFHSDRPAEKDSLGWSSFAENLARSLPLPEGSESVVVGIEGTWGSGKSTFIEFIKRSLLAQGNADPKASKPIIVEFNPWAMSEIPWATSEIDALDEELITQISVEIGNHSGGKFLKVAENLLLYAGFISSIKWSKYIPKPRNKFSEKLLEALGFISKKAQENIKECLSEIDLGKRKSDVIAGLAGLNRPLIIIIDDLDRLPPEGIRLIIKMIKTVLDFPRTLYLLAYDKSIVARALGSDNEEDGLQHLEKIVQAAYRIPVPSHQQLKQFAEEKISNLLTGLKITLRPFEEALYAPAIDQVARLSRHTRDIVRTTNRLLLILPVICKEVNVADAIVFEALSQRFPKSRENLCPHCESILEEISILSHPSAEHLSPEEWNMWKMLAAKEKTQQGGNPLWSVFLPEDSEGQQVAEGACRFLFSSSQDTSAMDGLRIAAPGQLDRYLKCVTVDGFLGAEKAYEIFSNPENLESEKAHAILSDPEKLEQELSVSDDKELSFRLARLGIYIPSCSTLDVEGCMEKLIDKSRHTVEFEVSHNMSEVMWKLLRHAACTLDEREKCFLNIVEKASVPVSGSIVCDVKKACDKNHPLLKDNAFLEESIKKWIDRAREAMEGGLGGRSLHHVLHRLADLQNGSYTEVHALTSEMCETDNGLDNFLSGYYYLRKNDPRRTLYTPFYLIENPEDIARRIEKYGSTMNHSWLVDILYELPTVPEWHLVISCENQHAQ